uniref:probable G-protein coupled receptor 139 n=1 Tax=Pristiophorus japonicus TaxID=55135 RepID=UPI00398F1CA3
MAIIKGLWQKGCEETDFGCKKRSKMEERIASYVVKRVNVTKKWVRDLLHAEPPGDAAGQLIEGKTHKKTVEKAMCQASCQAINSLYKKHRNHQFSQQMGDDSEVVAAKDDFSVSTSTGELMNLVAIVILSRGKCGLSTCTTRYLVAMAAADLLVVITGVILWQISWYYFPGSFLDITPLCTVRYLLVRVATDCSVWFTVTFTFDRFVAICLQKLKTKYCTGRTAAVVLATSCILLSSKNIPFYFTREPLYIIDNVPWSCVTIIAYFTEPGWVGFDRFDSVVTPLLPFALILLLNALTVRHILVASRVRKGLRGESKGGNGSDPEMESRRKSVILLFTISGSFILLWLVIVIDFLYYSIAGINPDFYSLSLYTFAEVGFILQNLSCCTNTFIYGVTQSKFREQLKSAVKYPLTSIIQLINKQNN